MSYRNEEHKEIAEKLRLSVKKEATEETVKIRLIQPFFNKVLGWPLDKMAGEYIVSPDKGEKVDYALSDQTGKPKYLIEAKSPRKNLDKYTSQLIRYMKLSGVKTGFLTNGEEYKVLTKKAEEYKITDSFSIDEAPPEYMYKKCNKPEFLSPENYFEKIISRVPDTIPEKLATSIALQPLSKQNTPLHMGLFIDSNIIQDFYGMYRNLGINITTIKQTKEGYKVNIKKDSDVIVIYAPYEQNLPIETILKEQIHIKLDEASDFPENIPLLVLSTPKFGMYDIYEETPEQLLLSSFEVSNFHFIKIIFGQDQTEKDYNNINSLDRKSPVYIKREFSLPKLPPWAEKKIQENYEELCERHMDHDFPLSYREKEAIKNFSQLKTLVSDSHVVKKEILDFVYSIIEFGFKEKAIQNNTREIDSNKVETSSPSSQRNRIQFVEDLIEELEEEYEDDEGVPIEELIERAEEEGFNSDRVEEDITNLSRRGDVIQPTNKTVRKLF